MRFAVDGVGGSDGAAVHRQSCYITCCSLECRRQDLVIGKQVKSVSWRDFFFCSSFVYIQKLPKCYKRYIKSGVKCRLILPFQ